MLTVLLSTLTSLVPLLWGDLGDLVLEGFLFVFLIQALLFWIFQSFAGIYRVTAQPHQYATLRWGVSGYALLVVALCWAVGFLVELSLPLAHLSEVFEGIAGLGMLVSLLPLPFASQIAFWALATSGFAHFYNKEVKAYRQDLVEAAAARCADVEDMEKWAELERQDRLTYWPDQVCLETRDEWDEWND